MGTEDGCVRLLRGVPWPLSLHKNGRKKKEPMDESLIIQAAAIRDEQKEAANTHVRVGSLLVQMLQVLGQTLTAEHLSWKASATGVDLRLTVPSAGGDAAEQVVDLRVPCVDTTTAGVMTPAQVSAIEQAAAELVQAENAERRTAIEKLQRALTAATETAHAAQTTAEEAKAAAEKKVDDDFDYSEVKHAADWCSTFVLGDKTGSEHPFLRYRVDTESLTLKLGHMLDGFTYAENVSIPLIDDQNGVFFDPYYYGEYIQPLFNGDYALVDHVDRKLEKKVDKVEGKGLSTNDFTDFYQTKLDSISGNANRYVLPAATKDELGGVKVGGDVRDSASSLPLDGASISREMDGTILVPYASASSHGASYDRGGAMSKAQVRKLYDIEAKAQVNRIEGIRVNGVLMNVGDDKVVDLIVSGGGDGTGDAETINALVAKVTQMQAEIDDLKNKLCLTYE